MSFLGIDIGTSGCKSVIFEQNGTVLSSAYEGYSVISSEPGFAELNSVEVMDKCFCVIRNAVEKSNGSPVESICISSQGEAFTPVGKNNEIIGNGMVSSDSRAASIVKLWTEKFGKNKLYEITGHTAYSMFSLFKLLWIKENNPELWNNSKAFYCYEDLLHLKLGLIPAISWPLAGRTMLFDVNKHEWNREILDAVGLQNSQLAVPMKTGSVVGEIPADIAKKLGLNNGVKVVTGGHDQTVGALGAGVIEEGTAMYATGTVECICPVFSSIHKSPELEKNNLCCYDFTLDGKYTTVAYSLTGGNILQWFKNEFAEKEIAEAEKTDQNVYELLLSQIDKPPTELLVLPYFTPTGTPYFDANAKGAILGLQMTTKRSEIMKALLEGVALEMKLNLDIMEKSGMKINKLIATGGGAKSKTWTQIKANVLNKPITVIEVEEAGCFGAAMIACSAVTGIEVEKLVSQNKKEIMQIQPVQQQVECYNKKFETYKKIYPTIKSIME